MGGRGSGRRASRRATLDDWRKFDLRELRRQGCLQLNYSGSLRWTRNGRETGSVGFSVAADVLTLRYRTRNGNDEPWQDVCQRVPLVSTPQHLGGTRTWLGCPGCQRRCAVLYGGQRFRCRICASVPYASQHEQADDRKLRRAQTIRMRLGGSSSTLDPFPAKPKGMRWTTYWRLHINTHSWTEASLLNTIKRVRLLCPA